jgi:hypothetical protein
LQFQLLRYGVEVTADDDRLASTLAYLGNSAVQDVPVESELRYHVDGVGPYRIHEENQPVETSSNRDGVLNVLYGRCYGQVVSRFTQDGWTPIHAGLVTIAGRRLLVVGHKGVGKTTLMLRLLHDGHRVEGDEMVFTRDGSAVPLPRAFHLKQGTEALVPELAGRLDTMPSTPAAGGRRVTAFDPGRAGFDWHLSDGPIHAAVVLRADHRADSSLRPISNLDLVKQAVEHSFPPNEARPPLLHACAALVGHVDGAELTVGSVHTAARLLADFATVTGS